jgi:hypothetical protein
MNNEIVKYDSKTFYNISIKEINKYYNYEIYVINNQYPNIIYKKLGYFNCITYNNKYNGRFSNPLYPRGVYYWFYIDCKNIYYINRKDHKFYINYENNKLSQELLTQIKLNPRVLFKLKYIEDKMSDESKEYWKNNIYKK